MRGHVQIGNDRLLLTLRAPVLKASITGARTSPCGRYWYRLDGQLRLDATGGWTLDPDSVWIMPRETAAPARAATADDELPGLRELIGEVETAARSWLRGKQSQLRAHLLSRRGELTAETVRAREMLDEVERSVQIVENYWLRGQA